MGALAELIDKDPDVNLTVLCAKPNRYKQSAKFKRSDNACVKTFWVPAHNSSIISQAIGYSFFLFKRLSIRFLFQENQLSLEQALKFHCSRIH